ncbi:MAG: hypothetical protein MUF07_04845 [Steroidobacteraceae bacterium]|jgi:hypothetical protein|nr:hypothetical protein [Steroidobacteraceae bacterium]
MSQRPEFQDWIDYVRGVASPERAARMAADLAAGSADALRLHALATSLQQGLRWSLQTEVPGEVLRRAEALFATTRPAAPPSLGTRLATLVLDTLATPQLAGARAGASAVRHTTHRAGDYEVGLRFERLPGAERVSVVGQVLPVGAGRPAPRAFPVTALRRDQVVTRAVGTDRGEFQLELPPRGASRLVLDLGGAETLIEIDLEALDKRAARGKTARGEGPAPRTDESRD